MNLTYLLVSLMCANLICACVGIVAWTRTFIGGNRHSVVTYKIFGGLSYTLLGFTGLLVKNMWVGAATLYLPLLCLAFIALGVYMMSSGLKAKRAA